MNGVVGVGVAEREVCNLCYVLGGCNGMPREEDLLRLLVLYYYFVFTSESRSAEHKAIVIHNKHSLAALL